MSCRRCDGASTEVAATAISLDEPFKTAVCPSSGTKTIRELQAVDLTTAGTADLARLTLGSSGRKIFVSFFAGFMS